ncbi:laccase with copper binding domain [Schizothecium vesticola]|uniref:Laccase with copper binding domain n=1 Tax=Schizothecium vesticola TaxID=314040 RepID=A0AA40F174_9PEZI|nr:laccase with copper binding domain [Schizothecium vesticola]
MTAAGKLAQKKTNGSSMLGTLMFPFLSYFLTNNPIPDGYPWGKLTDWDNNPYSNYPNTGVVRTYDFTVSRGIIAPDGYERDVLLVNGAFPGPLIEVNWGDKVVVHVHNNITGPEEGTAIHWHGLLQQGTPWEDGSPGISQCPIAPSKSLTYEFIADLYGTSWYHSHYSAQYADGVTGPIVVHGPTQARYDIDVGPIMLSDWHHRDYYDIVTEMLAPHGNPRVTSDNNLINGKMNFDCSTVAAGDTTACTPDAGLAKFKFQQGKTHRLRLINSGADGIQQFSIDNHTMTVIANDFTPIHPYTTTTVTLAVGQRTDVLVTASAASTTSVWMRSRLTCASSLQPLALAAVYYNDANPNLAPTSTPSPLSPTTNQCANDDLSLTAPLFPMPLFRNESDVALWKFNNISMRTNYNTPSLLQVLSGNPTFPPERNILNFHANTSVRLVVVNRSPGPHPMHLHGHNPYILAEGLGTWDGITTTRPENPLRRDVQVVRAGGFLVLQFDANPGVWGFHCHIAWHASGGFMAGLVVRPDVVVGMTVPGKVEETCEGWEVWTRGNVVEQIDSGT